MAKRRIQRRLERVSENPVTHELEVTRLDAVQLAFERVVACLDRERLHLSAAECVTLVDRVAAALVEMVPHTEVTS